MYRFNNGRGAVICDQCRVMIDADLSLKEYEEMYDRKDGNSGDFCWACKNGIKPDKKIGKNFDDERKRTGIKEI